MTNRARSRFRSTVTYFPLEMGIILERCKEKNSGNREELSWGACECGGGSSRSSVRDASERSRSVKLPSIITHLLPLSACFLSVQRNSEMELVVRLVLPSDEFVLLTRFLHSLFALPLSADFNSTIDNPSCPIIHNIQLSSSRTMEFLQSIQLYRPCSTSPTPVPESNHNITKRPTHSEASDVLTQKPTVPSHRY